MLTQEKLKSLLSYDQSTGLFTWIKPTSNRVCVGYIAGSPNLSGYWQIKIDYTMYMNHRLAWLYVYGEWPKNQIDHIDNIRHHNWISNLREATRSQNIMNTGVRKDNVSGHKGVHYNARLNKWQAIIFYNKKNRFLGTFTTPEEAAAEYKRFAEVIAGEFLHESLR